MDSIELDGQGAVTWDASHMHMPWLCDVLLS